SSWSYAEVSRRTLPMKNLATFVSAAACVAVLTSPVFQAAQHGTPTQAAHHGTPSNLRGITSAPEPPAGFDPITATDQELGMYGFPPRPNPQAQPHAYAQWGRAMRASKQRIVPQLKVTNKYHGPLIPGNTPSTSFNWSGAVMTDGAT